MRKYLLSILGLAVMLVTVAQKPAVISDNRLASLDTAFQRVLQTWKTAGFAVAVVEKNKIIYAKGFGYRDHDKKLPVTTNTLFCIGSCTKAFTTSLIGLLQKDGKLDIDKPAHQYLNDLNFFTSDLTNNITLRDMMSHRTGLPRHDFSWYLFGTDSRDTLLRRIQYHEPTYPLRRQWQYNNFMFIGQGVIAEKITGKSWEQNIRERIFSPLGMSTSNFSVIEMEKSADAALGYGLKKDSIIHRLPYHNINAPGPAGSINSNVMEMGKWVITWINDGKFNGKEILPSDFVRDAISSQAVIGPGFPGKEKPDIHFANYGLGWSLSSYKGHYRVDHGGNIDGFSANTSFFPSDSIGIIVLVNQNGSAVPSIVRNIIADKLLGLPYFNWNNDQRASFEKNRKLAEETKTKQKTSKIEGTKPSHALMDYEGLYSHPGYGTMDLFTKNDSLFARAGGKLLWLQHYHYDVFVPFIQEDGSFDTSEPGQMRLQFNTGTSGEIESMNVHGFEAPSIKLVFNKAPKEKKVSKSMLEQYAGNFEIMGAELRIYLKGDKLHMFVPQQPEYELIPTGDDKFSVRDLTGYSIQFLRDNKKEVTAVNLIQPNGTFKAEKKK